MKPAIYLLALVSTVLLSGLLVLSFQIKTGKNLKLLLAYSGAYILALCFFELIPEVYEHSDGSRVIGLFVMAGFILQVLLDYISGGIEHGHVHTHEHGHHEEHHHDEHEHHHPVTRTFPMMMMTGLCIHAFLEGIPLIYSGVREELFMGIIFHNVPISMMLMTYFLSAGRSVKQGFMALALFSVMTPLGAVAAKLLIPESSGAEEHYGIWALAVVVGIFLHISTIILFESDKNHRFNLLKLATIVLGVVTAFLLN